MLRHTEGEGEVADRHYIRRWRASIGDKPSKCGSQAVGLELQQRVLEMGDEAAGTFTTQLGNAYLTKRGRPTTGNRRWLTRWKNKQQNEKKRVRSEMKSWCKTGFYFYLLYSLFWFQSHGSGHVGKRVGTNSCLGQSARQWPPKSFAFTPSRADACQTSEKEE
ncbi:hypothetical protein LY76DRAFT_290365 [Colletotrichum caudatum]|nr:hypothetical protein LY76DRAFT_290365 [Colletotrichum caudatum]